MSKSLRKRVLTIDTPEWALPLLQPARYKGVHGGRGASKSHQLCELLVERHIVNKDCRSACFRAYQRSIDQSVKQLIESKIRKFNAGAYFEIYDKWIKNKLGNGIIIFEGLQNHTADSIKSFENFDTFFVEEAQTIKPRPLDLLRTTMRKDGGERWFAWNPRFQDDAIDKLLRGPVTPPDSVVIEVTYKDNPYPPEDLLKELEFDKESMDPAEFNHKWLGHYESRSDACVFRKYEVREFDAPPGTHFRFGIDFGYSVDPTVLVRCFKLGREIFIDYEAYMHRCDTIDLPDLMMTIPEVEKWPIIGDKSRPETISYLNSKGFNVLKSISDKKEGIKWLQSHTLVIHPRCKHVAHAVKVYRFKTDENGNVLPIIDHDKSDSIDAIRYAFEGERRLNSNKTDVSDVLPSNRW